MRAEREKIFEVAVREYEPEKDRAGAEAVDRMCDVGPTGGVSLFTDNLGDPVCRVRHSPAFLMLVAESCGKEGAEIVGLIRGCVKTVACGKTTPRPMIATSGDGGAAVSAPIYTKAAYILGLRVSPSHRRMGIGLKLVNRMEEWFRSKGAEYSYMATDKSNVASLRLFVGQSGYAKFRTPRILVQPVHAHRLSLPKSATLLRLPPAAAESLYRHRFSTTEFFPLDVDSILHNPLSLGTFLALPEGSTWTDLDRFIAAPPESWAVLSVWDCSSLFRLELRGAPRLIRGLAWTSRAVDRAVPWLGIPSVPDLFRPFGGYFLYGIGGDGPEAARLLRRLCRHAHNMAREGGCGVVATEVAAGEPLMAGIPHWRRLSIEEDLWCVKRLVDEYGDGGAVGDWTRSKPGNSIFVDPREV